MTPVSGPHLSADDLDAWLTGSLPAALSAHLAGCPDCQERASLEREIVGLLAALPQLSPAAGFSDRVMAQVRVPEPVPVGSVAAIRRRFFATPRATALAASILVLLVGSMTASVVWTLGHQATLAALGSWLTAQAGSAVWLGVRGLASNFIEQPWFSGVKAVAASPGRLALASSLAALAYLAGVLALRRLLALPSQQVAHASA